MMKMLMMKIFFDTGAKFGCDEEACGDLLQVAAELRLCVVGVSFHVGSGCREAGAFLRAIRMARRVFDVAEAMGFNMTLLDIGGGFPGDALDDLDNVNKKKSFWLLLC